ncbi:tetratricopeptide repeat protein [Rhizobium nepotum]|uniref:tetratricopeptide repeat protein n=1 Tax=Rhizobium nepotum TaxID=1035271 RepID=UPI003CF6A62F
MTAAIFDPIEAVRWYREAADQDHAGAQYRLAQLNEHGVGCEINLTEAFKWYRRAARSGLSGCERRPPRLMPGTSRLATSDIRVARWQRSFLMASTTFCQT